MAEELKRLQIIEKRCEALEAENRRLRALLAEGGGEQND
jgi:cell shape-determining protein MreC